MAKTIEKVRLNQAVRLGAGKKAYMVVPGHPVPLSEVQDLIDEGKVTVQEEAPEQIVSDESPVSVTVTSEDAAVAVDDVVKVDAAVTPIQSSDAGDAE